MQRFNATADPALLVGDERPAAAVTASRSSVYLNGRATRTSARHLRADRRLVSPDEALPVGAHLLAPRRGYTHHGIHVGDGRVVHYAGLARARVRGPIEEVSLEEFTDGQCLFVKIDAPAYPAESIVDRARSRIGENRYRITTNNCEHFCEWCLRGESRSEQVERWLVWPRRIAQTLVNSFRLAPMLRLAPILRFAPVLRFAPAVRRTRSRATTL
jgi:hypothetical protein